MPALEQLVQLVLVGVTQGSIYALIALGFVTIYNVTGIINFAQGEFAMLGAMAMVSLTALGLPLGMAFPLAIIVVVLVGGGIERLAIQPASGFMPAGAGQSAFRRVKAEDIEALIDAAFWASLRRQEGYMPRLSLAILDPAQAR